MPGPPTGAVTLLFTDIEGSTRLLQRSGELYPALLADHRRVLRAAFDAHDGYEVDTEGDAFFVVFPSARDAVAAAADAQRMLARHRWRDGHELRVRMGVHSGEPQLVDGGYVGLDVHRAARVMASGHGGQVVVSHATRSRLDAEWPVLDLGEHRLKDLLQPEHLYQLVIEGLPLEFPALKTLGNRPTNLPTQPNALVGRRSEVEATAELVRNERLVTLTGPGGTGKTRIALQVGAELLDEFRSGVFFVSLAPIAHEKLVIPAIAETLAVRKVAGEDLTNSLHAYLSDKVMLLVLDNLEHIIAAAPRVAGLLAAAPDVRVLVTSRERLHLRREQVYEVPTLGLPPSANESLATMLESDSIALFVARAQAADPSFRFTEDNAAEVVAICRALDGLPLALELAAARIPVLSPIALLARLDKRLSLLTRGERDAEQRQRTLRGTIEWSFDLLDKAEQAFFARLAIFVDGCRLEAAEEVCQPSSGVAGLDLVHSLVDKSLVRQRLDPNGELRFWMLETIREYAGERLEERRETELFMQRHAECFLELAEQAEPALWAQQTDEWLTRLDVEQPNLRLALEHALAHDAQLALRLAGALYPFWEIRGKHAEARAWLTRALACDDGVPGASRAKALIGAGRASAWEFDWPVALDILEEAVDLCRKLGDVEGIGRCLGFIGHTRLFTGDREGATAALDEALALARASGSRRSVMRALNNAAAAAIEERDFVRAHEMYAEVGAIAHAEGSRVSRGISAIQRGYVSVLAGAYERAARELDDGLGHLAGVGETTWTPLGQRYTGLLKLLTGKIEEAETILRKSLTEGRDQAPAWELVYWVEGLAAVAAAKGEATRAATLWGATDGLWHRFRLAVLEESHQVRERFYKEVDRQGSYHRAWSEGRTMALEEALAYALSQDGEGPDDSAS